MHIDNPQIIPGLARLGGEMYLKTEHPFKYAQLLIQALDEHHAGFTLGIQVGLEYIKDFLREVEHYRFDVAQSGFREYLTFKRRDVLEDERINPAESQEIIALLYNIDILNDHLETLHRIAKETVRDDLMRDILRSKDE